MLSMANRAGVWYTLTWIILQKHPRLGKEKHTMMENNTPRRPAAARRRPPLNRAWSTAKTRWQSF